MSYQSGLFTRLFIRNVILLIFLGIGGNLGYSQSTLLWSDDFEDGNSDGWLFYDDVSGPSDWFVDGGYLKQFVAFYYAIR